MEKEVKILFIIITVSAVIKIILTDFTITQNDSQLYYNLTVQFANTGTLDSKNIFLHNLGLIVINSFFFKIFDGFIPLIILHKSLSIIYSTASLYFAYLFLSHIFEKKYALIGTALLSFDWRLIQNSTFGITEPLFLLFVWASLAAKKNLGLACILAGCATIVRIEGVVIFPILLTLYLSERKKIVIPHLMGFVAPLGLTNSIPYQTNESTKIFGGTISHEITNVSMHADMFYEKLANSIIYFGWSTFPNFFFLIPFGFYSMLKKKAYLICLVISALPGIWAYLDSYDTRYFFLTFIFLDVMAVYGLQFLRRRIEVQS